ncbi:MAG: hypothetical protein IKX72_02720, partial [Oscillospiraceae bacterium]|nr:hypothetical protein [Oscillospiraceae bacterium]
MKKALTLILALILLISLTSCKDKKEELLDELEGKWIGYEDGYLYYAIFRRTEEEGYIFYGPVREMTKDGGAMTELEKT